jgi:hypothetical protein
VKNLINKSIKEIRGGEKKLLCKQDDFLEEIVGESNRQFTQFIGFINLLNVGNISLRTFLKFCGAEKKRKEVVTSRH